MTDLCSRNYCTGLSWVLPHSLQKHWARLLLMLQTSDLAEFNQLLLCNLRHHGFIQITGVRCTAVYIFVYSDLKNCVWTATKRKQYVSQQGKKRKPQGEVCSVPLHGMAFLFPRLTTLSYSFLWPNKLLLASYMRWACPLIKRSLCSMSAYLNSSKTETMMQVIISLPGATLSHLFCLHKISLRLVRGERGTANENEAHHSLSVLLSVKNILK